MSGIQFLTDEKGRKTAAVIDLKVHKALWEDIQDVLVSRARRHEKGVSLDKVKAGLIASGKLRGKYSVELKASARKELERLPAKLIQRIFPKLEGLASERVLPDAKS